ncbi:hypothetical protein LCGC14_2495110 [marine sediment metagenome]|uniref:Large ribosomal subunit protein bL12 C-terminal domain-containing protein n=1 Tax=marine sediment metagenome TaxID=412755 RepID=A0A0F9DXB6_9ZZZZ
MRRRLTARGMGWASGVGLLALMITMLIGMYMWAKMVEPLVPTSNPADNIYNKVLQQTTDIQDTLNRRAEEMNRGFEDPVRSPGTEDQPDKKLFDVVLLDEGPRKIQVIKAVQKLTGLGLARAKDLVESAPQGVVTGVSRNEATKAKAALEAAGAKVEIR